MTVCVLAVAFLTLAPLDVPAQTNATQTSPVGTWKADLAKAGAGTDPAPKAVTLTIEGDA